MFVRPSRPVQVPDQRLGPPPARSGDLPDHRDVTPTPHKTRRDAPDADRAVRGPPARPGRGPRRRPRLAGPARMSRQGVADLLGDSVQVPALADGLLRV